MSTQTVNFQDLGVMPYKEAWDYQETLLRQNLAVKQFRREQESIAEKGGTAVSSGETAHHLLLLEHPPVYTLGKSGHMENVLLTDRELAEKHIEFFQTNRGGDITFHGPGQLVGYPVLDLERYYTDIGRYLRNLEEVIIRTIGEFGIRGDRSPGETGVWLDPDIRGKERKICAMGVKCSRWITIHGFALNVNTDLRYFEHIIPCGIQDKQVTSMQRELGTELSMDEVKQVLREKFSEVFDSELVTKPVQMLT